MQRFIHEGINMKPYEFDKETEARREIDSQREKQTHGPDPLLKYQDPPLEALMIKGFEPNEYQKIIASTHFANATRAQKMIAPLYSYDEFLTIVLGVKR